MKAILAVLFICSGALAKPTDQVAHMDPAKIKGFLSLCERTCMAGGRRTQSECKAGCGLMTISMVARKCNQEPTDDPNICSVKQMNAHFNGENDRVRTTEATSSGTTN